MQRNQRLELSQAEDWANKEQGPLIAQKLAKARRKNRNSLVKALFITQMIIPQSLNMKRYFRTKYDVQLCLDTYQDNLLGELSVNIFSIGYRVVTMVQEEDKLTFELQARLTEYMEVETILKVLEHYGMKTAIQNLMHFIQKYQTMSKCVFATPAEVAEAEYLSSQYPYECYLTKIYQGGSHVVRYTMNQKYLVLMGINNQMLEEHLRTSNTLPCAIRVDNYINVWNQVFSAVVNDRNEFSMELQNYNGQRQQVSIQQRQLYFASEDGEECIYCLVYWIYMVQPNEAVCECNYQAFLDLKFPKPKQCQYQYIDQKYSR